VLLIENEKKLVGNAYYSGIYLHDMGIGWWGLVQTLCTSDIG